MGKAKIETRAAELVAGGRAKLEPLFRVTRPPDGMKTIRFANLGMESLGDGIGLWVERHGAATVVGELCDGGEDSVLF